MFRYILMNLPRIKLYENLFYFLVITTLKITIRWNVTVCNLVEIFQHSK